MSEKIKPLIGEQAIAARVAQLAAAISSDYRERDPVLVGILKGAWLFLADLARRLDIPAQIDFMGLSSYGPGREPSGKVRIISDLSVGVRDRHVLIVEDIIDTGLTTRYLLQNLRSRGPASLAVCALLDKPGRRRVQVPLDYVGFVIPDRFVVGYGMDHDQRYRQLPYIAELETGSA